MKQLLTALLFFLVNVVSYAQKEQKYILRLDEFDVSEKISLPFRAVKILDARFDQDNIGCLVKSLSFSGITLQKMLAVFPESTTIYLPKILSNVMSFDENTTDTLLLLLKNFRLTDHVPPRSSNYNAPESLLTISCSFYLLKNNYASKISSVDQSMAEPWANSRKPAKDEIPSLRVEAILKLISQLFKSNNWVPSNQRYPLSEMETAVRKKVSTPIFQDSLLMTGVYKTFEEFIKNAPSIREVVVIRQKNGDIKEVMDIDSNNLAIQNYWGYCDGKNKYIFFQKGVHKLDLVDRTFRIKFYRRKSEGMFVPGHSTYSPNPGGGFGMMNIQTNSVSGTAYDAYNEHLYLNMETGKIYVEEVIGTAPMRKFRGKS